MIILTGFFAVAFLALFASYLSLKNSLLLSLTITTGTFLYHFVMRLAVGFIVDYLLNNKVDYTLSWFQEKTFEKKLYKKLKINKLKKFAPTFSPETFSFENADLKKIVMATCQAEIVHELIAVLSFVPLFFAIMFGEFWVFLITSLIAALFDLFFVLVQRYNRPRLLKLLNKTDKNN